MAQSKGKKNVALQIPDDISVDSVVSAIRARGSEDGSVKVCSVKKIKDFILEKDPNRDMQMLNKRLKEALILGVEENVIQRPTQQSHSKPDLRGSFQVPAQDVQANKGNTSTKAGADAKNEEPPPKDKGKSKKPAVTQTVSNASTKSNASVKSDTSSRSKKAKQVIISDDEADEDDGVDEQEVDGDKPTDGHQEEELEDEEEEQGEEEEEEVEEEEELIGEEEEEEEEESVGSTDESPTKEFLSKVPNKGRHLAAAALGGKDIKAMKGRKL